jgi:hypothetical protein
MWLNLLSNRVGVSDEGIILTTMFVRKRFLR